MSDDMSEGNAAILFTQLHLYKLITVKTKPDKLLKISYPAFINIHNLKFTSNLQQNNNINHNIRLLLFAKAIFKKY